LHALQDFPASQQFLDAIGSCESINLKQFKLTLCKHIIVGWRELDNLTPHETSPFQLNHKAHYYRTHFGVPLGIVPGWWNDKNRNHKPVLPLYLRLDNSAEMPFDAYIVM
jgi:hypothetical protein